MGGMSMRGMSLEYIGCDASPNFTSAKFKNCNRLKEIQDTRRKKKITIFVRHEESARVCSMDVYYENTLEQILWNFMNVLSIYIDPPLFVNEMNMQKTFDNKCTVGNLGLKNGSLLTIYSETYQEQKQAEISEIAM